MHLLLWLNCVLSWNIHFLLTPFSVVYCIIFSQKISVIGRAVKRIKISERDAKTWVQFIKTFNFSTSLSLAQFVDVALNVS